MIASVLPLRRLPRRIGALTYSVPKAFQKRLRVGQLVSIPFRAGDIFGLIADVSTINEQPSTTKDITSIVQEEPVLSHTQISFIKNISECYGVSPSVIAGMMLPPLQKNKLKKINLVPSRSTPPHIRGRMGGGLELPIYYLYSSEVEHKKLLRSICEGTILILVPEVHLIDEVRQLLSVGEQKRAVVWHSQLTQKQQFERWVQVRNGVKNIIIGTRGAVFLPFPQLDSILIDYEHDENHKHWDQAPRFHVKDVAMKLQEFYGAELHLASFNMSAESYFAVHKGLYKIQDTNNKIQDAKLTNVVNMADERRGGNYNLFSEKVAKAILETKGDIFLYINRKGFATAVGCNDCGFIARCALCQLPFVYSEKEHLLRCHYCGTKMDMLVSCPKCRSTMVKLYGAGTELAEKEVRRLVGESHGHEIIRVESDYEAEAEYSKKSRLVIGTDKAFAFVRWNKNELVVFVDIDKQLAIPEFRATEEVWHKIAEVNFRQTSGDFFIQTFNPEHLIFRSLKEPDRWYRTELNGRKKLVYPPYAYLARYLFADTSQRISTDATNQLYTQLKKELTESQKKITLHPPVPIQPQYYRGKFWYTIIAKLPVEQWQEELVWLNSLVPDDWKIDPNPISLLSP